MNAIALSQKCCDLCGSDRKTPIRVEKNYAIVRCDGCALIYVDHVPEIDNGKVSDIGEYYFNLEGQISDEKGHGFIRRFLIEEMNRLRPQKGTMLDVGCGFGFLMVDAQSQGWQVAGTELSEVAVKYAHEQQGLSDVWCTDLDELSRFGKKYQVLNLTNVLEHVPYPAQTLASCKNLMEEDGFIFIRVPNMDFFKLVLGVCKFLKLFGLDYLDRLEFLASPPPVHLTGFTPNTLRRYFDKLGLETVFIKPSKLNHRGRSLKIEIFEALVQTIYMVSAKTINLSPTVLAVAKRTAGAPRTGA